MFSFIFFLLFSLKPAGVMWDTLLFSLAANY